MSVHCIYPHYEREWITRTNNGSLCILQLPMLIQHSCLSGYYELMIQHHNMYCDHKTIRVLLMVMHDNKSNTIHETLFEQIIADEYILSYLVLY
jgi:hypothetical protein